MKKKIFILGNWNLQYSWFVKTFQEGFMRNGYEVYGMDLKHNLKDRLDIIESYIKELNPMYIFDHMSFRDHPKRNDLFDVYHRARKQGSKVIHVLGDAYLERYRGDLRTIFDCVLLGKTQNMKRLSSEWKVPIHYCLYSSLCYDKIVEPMPNLVDFKELVFTGNPNIHKDRSKFLHELNKIMPLRVFQTQSANDKRNQTRELSSTATAILGACTGYDVNGYIDVRPFQYMGAGACMIMRKFKDMDTIFPDDIYYPFDSYDDPHVVKELFDRAKSDMSDNIEMRQKAFDFIQTHHNCEKRMADVVEVIEGRKDYIPQRLDEI
jgi:hypothetical protein